MSLNAKSTIESGKAILGIEFGSTRIKAVLIDEKTSLSPKEATHGKTNLKTVCGHTVLMLYGTECRTVMQTSAQT